MIEKWNISIHWAIMSCACVRVCVCVLQTLHRPFPFLIWYVVCANSTAILWLCIRWSKLRTPVDLRWNILERWALTSECTMVPLKLPLNSLHNKLNTMYLLPFLIICPKVNCLHCDKHACILAHPVFSFFFFNKNMIFTIVQTEKTCQRYDILHKTSTESNPWCFHSIDSSKIFWLFEQYTI